VAIGGKNKYFINGKTASLERVQNLFHSVQLNVNNPHFLIMQGRITKVLNMKPPEILGMIEEAAGTKMFENKKKEALKTIEKKDSKLIEIDNILKNEITPTLEKLSSQRQGFIKWSQNNTKLETLKRFCVAYDYTKKQEILENGDKLINDANEEASSINEELTETVEKINKIEKKVEGLKQKKNENLKEELKEYQKKSTELSKVLVQNGSVYQHKKDQIESDKENIKSLEDSIKEVIIIFINKKDSIKFGKT
jgi:structural maintenance of chromosome 2